MQQLLDFLFRYRILGLFLFLEFICFWLFVSYNQYYNAYFFNSSNYLAGSVQSFSYNATEYFKLKNTNNQLADENARLREMLSNRNLQPYAIFDTLNQNTYFEIVPAKVINNTVNRSSNFLTLSVGKKEGVSPEMGVITSNGIVGKVKSVSSNFSTVISALNREMLISAQLQETNTLGTVQWDGQDPIKAKLKYIPRHVIFNTGDTIVTSGFNSIFPENLIIGTISEFELPDESPFYDITISLSTDFQSLDYVYVVKNYYKEELDSLEVINE
jgi:rod shape-determining protein MreC